MSQGSKVMREDVIEGFRKAKETGKSCKTIEVVETELKAEPAAHSRGWHRSGAQQRTKGRADEEGDGFFTFLEMHWQSAIHIISEQKQDAGEKKKKQVEVSTVIEV